MNSPSIRRTVLIRSGVGIGLLLCFLFASVYLLVKHGLFRELDAAITQAAAMLADQIEYEENAISFEWEEGMGSNQSISSDGLFQFWNHRTGAITRSPALGSHDLPKFSGLDGEPLLRDVILSNGKRGRAIGLRVYPFVLPEDKAEMVAAGTFIDPKLMPHTLVVAGNAEALHLTILFMQRILAGGFFLTLLVGFLIVRWSISASLRPIDELAAEMGNRAESQLDAPLELSGKLPSELIPVAKNFGLLLNRVATVRQREKDFIRHAAHELRTPVAGLRATVDLALSQPRDTRAYVEHLEDCRKSAVGMGELVNRLSALARTGQQASPALLESFDAKAVLEECMERFEPLFLERAHMVNLEQDDGPMLARGDITLCTIIFNNLLDNAVSYAPTASEIRIRGGIVDGKLSFRFSNLAEVSPGDLDRIFEPLFRKEQSRSDTGNHLGIGLTLAQSAATSMEARLEAHMINGNWIEFVLDMQPA